MEEEMTTDQRPIPVAGLKNALDRARKTDGYKLKAALLELEETRRQRDESLEMAGRLFEELCCTRNTLNDIPHVIRNINKNAGRLRILCREGEEIV